MKNLIAFLVFAAALILGLKCFSLIEELREAKKTIIEQKDDISRLESIAFTKYGPDSIDMYDEIIPDEEQ